MHSLYENTSATAGRELLGKTAMSIRIRLMNIFIFQSLVVAKSSVAV